MTYDELVAAVTQIIRDALEAAEPTINVTKMPGDRPEFVVISDDFVDLTQKERQDLLWGPIKAELGPEAQRIALILPRTWDDVR